MKISSIKILSAFALILAFALLAGAFVAFTDCAADNVAEAAEIKYATASPSNLKDNEYAGQSTVAVRDGDTEEILFYLIESYYYPVTKTASIYTLDIGLNVYVEASALTVPPAVFEGVTPANALPAVNLQTKGNVSVDGNEVNTADGWTVKLIGLNGDNLFVKAMKNDVEAFGSAAKTAFNDFNLAYHPVSQAQREGLLTETPDSGGTLGSTDSGKQSKTLRIILIIGIIIPAVIIVLLLFKPSRKDGGGYDKRPARERKNNDRVEYDRDRRYGRDYDRDSDRTPERYDRDPRYERNSRYDDPRYDREPRRYDRDDDYR